jgi:hypothetical protein
MNQNDFRLNSKILITGLVRNAQFTLLNDLNTFQRAFANFSHIQYLLVESDSSDSTLLKLDQISKELENFSYVTLGSLDSKIPAREARIGFCRNAYLAQLRDNPKYKEVEYLVVADWDGINSELDPVAIESCLQVSGWDGCFANQYRYYYDIYALRHPVWSPNDCWKYESFLRSIGLSHIEAREKAVYSRQKHIPSNSPWIPVHSAFGGLAIYRVSSIKLASYQGYEQDGSLTCEHVSFNLEILRTGGKLFINPSLINSHGNPHTLNRSRINRLKWNIKRGLVKVFKFYAHKSI